MTKVPHSSATALSADLRTLYVAVSNGNSGYLVALDSTTLAPLARVLLTDPNTGQNGLLSDNGSASPTVGTGGDGQNKIAILDSIATQTDAVTGATVMKEVLTILGPTPEPAGGVEEWCNIPPSWTRSPSPFSRTTRMGSAIGGM